MNHTEHMTKRGEDSMRKSMKRTKGRSWPERLGLLMIAGMLSVTAILAGGMLSNPAEATVAITGCGDCHGYPPVDGTTRDGATGQFRGSHGIHAGWATTSGQYAMSCTVCHQNPNWTSFNHQSGTVTIRTPFNGQWGSYSKPTGFTVSNAPAMGTCSGLYCHSTAQGPTGTGAITYRTPTWATILGCGGCHVDMNTASGTGSHPSHVTTSGYVCNVCHGNGYWPTGNNAATTHVNQNINLAFSVTNTYSKSTSFAANSAAYGNCTNSQCHGANSGTWSSNTNNAQCTKCHGLPSTAAQYTADSNRAAPGWSTGGQTGVSTSGATAVTDPDVGGHDAHLRSTQNYSDTNPCNSCHVVPATVTAAGHMSGRPALVTWGTVARFNGATPVWNTVTNTCSNVYCHGGAMPLGDTSGTSRVPVWTTNMLTGTPSIAECSKCHGVPPTAGTSAGTHVGYTTIGACNGCHGHVNLNGSFTTVGRSLHINGVVDGGGDCVSCHNSTQAITQGPLAGTGSRRAASQEFWASWSHKASGGHSATAADCIVCHMEGDASTKGTDAFYHKNGLIDLRNPDTGTVIGRVVWVSNGSASIRNGWYTDTGGWMTFARFTRQLNNATLEPWVVSVQFNHCLKCHDANGAASSLAWVSGGTASKPFNTTKQNAGGWYSLYYVANGTSGGVTNIARSFWMSNASYHPVMFKNNNTFVQGSTLMLAPWNSIQKSWSTLVGGRDPWGYLISCWDCHTQTTAQVGWMTGTGTAHGGPVTVRGAVRTAGTTATLNLCLNCHATRYATTTGSHGAPSAFTTGSGNMGASTFNSCYYCHGSVIGAAGGTVNAALIPRPIRGEEVHGFNERFPGNLTSVFATTNSRPFGFIRNSLSAWRPTRTPELTAAAAICTGTGGTCDNNMGNSAFGVGGKY